MITLTRKDLYYGGPFWQKLLQTPSQNNKHTYWIHKLHKKVRALQKQLNPEFQKLRDELIAKYSVKDKDGKPMVTPKDTLPRPAPEHEEGYSNLVEAFMDKEVQIDTNPLPLEYVSHIQKTPMDWEIFGEICNVTNESLEAGDAASQARAQLQAITGGQAG